MNIQQMNESAVAIFNGHNNSPAMMIKTSGSGFRITCMGITWFDVSMDSDAFKVRVPEHFIRHVKTAEEVIGELRSFLYN